MTHYGEKGIQMQDTTEYLILKKHLISSEKLGEVKKIHVQKQIMLFHLTKWDEPGICNFIRQNNDFVIQKPPETKKMHLINPDPEL